MIHDNTQLKLNFENHLNHLILSAGVSVTLQIVQVGDLLASNKYIQMKQKIGSRLGIEVIHNKFDTDAELYKLHNVITQAQSHNQGLIVQLPVPTQFLPIVSSISPHIDVDLLGADSGQLWDRGFLPPTIGAIDLTLKEILSQQHNSIAADLSKNFGLSFLDHKLNLSGVKVAVIGRGKLVGLPAIRYFSARGATIISIDIDTEYPQQKCREAEIVVSAAGQSDLVNSGWLKSGAIVIDAATSESGGQLVGDVDKGNFPAKAVLSPSPGGIGGLTVLYLFYNLYKLVYKK